MKQTAGCHFNNYHAYKDKWSITMKLKSVMTGLALTVAAASAQSAAIISVSAGDAAYLSGVESAFLGTLVASDTESFDGWDTSNAVFTGSQHEKWIDSATTLSTAVGDFTLTGAGQAGSNTNNGNLKIESSRTGEYGREVLASDATDFWLDSNDATNVVWNIDADDSYNAIGFYLADINDQGGRIKLTYEDGSTEEYQVNTSFPSGSLFYTTIISDMAITGASLYFDKCDDPNGCNSYNYSDGWGIDDITVGHHVPEPGTLALMGLGLAGLGFARRRKAS